MAEDEKKLPVIRTLKTDAESFAQKPQASIFAIAAEKLKRKPRPPDGPNGRGKKLWAAGVGIFLLLAALGGFLWYRALDRAAQKSQPVPPQDLIFADEKVSVRLDALSREVLIQKGREALFAALDGGAFRTVHFETETNGEASFLSAEEILKTSEINLPDGLAAQTSELTLGSLAKDGAIHPFLILKTGSFPDAFHQALSWEKTMPSSLRIFFKDLPLLDEAPVFKDRVVKNQDARVLESAGRTVAAYAFFNRNFLVLTDDEKSLAEIITRWAVFPPR
ncbi:MAG: hypothetical protein Q8Q97_03055 [bacterium]|nr:hypothetical protein [bacterium]